MGGSVRDCSAAGNQCNTGVCDEASDQCVSQPVLDGTPCNDGLFCTLTDGCQDGQCLGTGETCPDDANACTDNCDEVRDVCYPAMRPVPPIPAAKILSVPVRRFAWLS